MRQLTRHGYIAALMIFVVSACGWVGTKDSKEDSPSTTISRNDRSLDSNDLLTALEELRRLLFDERKDRIAKDEELEGKIANLEKMLNELAVNLTARIDALKQTDLELQEAIAAKSDLYDGAIAELNQKYGLQRAELVAIYQEQLSQELNELMAEREQAKVATTANVSQRITDTQAALNAAIAAGDTQLAAQLQAQLTALQQEKLDIEAQVMQQFEPRIRAVNQKIADASQLSVDLLTRVVFSNIIYRTNQLRLDLDSFRSYALQNFVTRQEMQQLIQTVYRYIDDVASVLNRDLSARIDQVRSDLSTEFNTKLTQAETRIAAIELDVSTFKMQTRQELDSVNATLNGFIAEANAQFSVISEKVLILDTRTSDMAEMRASLRAFATKITEFEVYAQVTNDSIAALLQQVDTLQGKSQQFDNDLAEMRLYFEQLLAQESSERQDLTLQITQLVANVARIEKRANDAYALAEANAARIAYLAREIQRESEELCRRIADLDRKFTNEIQTLRSEMTVLIYQIRDAAVNTVRDLGTEMRENFTHITVTIAELKQRIIALGDEFARLVSYYVKDADQIQAFIDESRTKKTESFAAMKDFATALANLETGVVNSLDVIFELRGINVSTMNTEFGTYLGSTCASVLDTTGNFAMLNGREWFFYLARQYTQELVLGSRADIPAIDAVFGGKGPYLAGSRMFQLLLIASLQPFTQDLEPACRVAVESWARRMIFDDTAVAAAVRNAIRTHQPVLSQIQTLYTRLTSMQAGLDGLDSIIRRYLKDALITDMSVNSALNDGTTAIPPLYPEFIELLMTIVDNEVRVASLEAEMQQILSIVRTLAQRKANSSEALQQLEEAISDLRKSMDDFAKATEDQINNLTGKQALAFQLIASLANRLGYDDIRDVAAATARELGGDGSSVTYAAPEIVAAYHFYLHRTNFNYPPIRCNGSPYTALNSVPSPMYTKCAVHTTQGGKSPWAWGQSWGNQFSMAVNGWSTQNKGSLGGHVLGANGMWIKGYDTNNAAELATAANLIKIPAGLPHAGNETTLGVHLVGRFDKVRFQIRTTTDLNWRPYDTTIDVDAGPFLVSQRADGINAEYEIPVPRIVATLNNCTTDREVTMTPMLRDGTVGTTIMKMTVHTFSPLVLDFTGENMLSTVLPTRSQTWFDLDADGIPNHTGWIWGKQGLLVRDVNGDGIINDGMELFGEATLLPNGQRAENGYAALAALDENQDGQFDARDSHFGQLRVWFDLNQDGVSQAHELRTLQDAEVTSIQLAYEELPVKEALQAEGDQIGNLVKYRSTFHGPKSCPKDGCRSYDVFFGSVQQKIAGQ